MHRRAPLIVLCGRLITAGEAQPDVEAFVFGLGAIVFQFIYLFFGSPRGDTHTHSHTRQSSGNPGSSDGTPVRFLDRGNTRDGLSTPRSSDRSSVSPPLPSGKGRLQEELLRRHERDETSWMFT